MSNRYGSLPHSFPSLRLPSLRTTGLRCSRMTANSPQTQATIDNYVADIDAAHWAAIATPVRESVSALGAMSRGTARNYLAAAAKFTLWVWQTTGSDLDLQSIYRPALVRRFMHDVMAKNSENYRYQTAQRLNVLVTAVTGMAAVRQTDASRSVAVTYSERDLAAYQSSAATRTTAPRLRNAHILLALGAGAGLRAAEIALARVGDIIVLDDRLEVIVRGKHPRRVPVHADWTHALRFGVGDRPADDWAFSGYRLPEYPARIVHQFGMDDLSSPPISATILRNTWIVGLLNASAPIDLILELAGLADATSLRCYVRAMRTHDVADYYLTVTGRESE